MPDKEKPEEACGLREKVSALESDIDNLRLTLAELIRKVPHCDVCNICQKQSITFNVFLPHVKPSLRAILFEFCLDLDYFLVSEPCGIYPIEFNLEKHPQSVCYSMLKDLWFLCFQDTHWAWYHQLIVDNCNLGNTTSAVKKGIERC